MSVVNRSPPNPEPTEDIPTKMEGPFMYLRLDIIGAIT